MVTEAGVQGLLAAEEAAIAESVWQPSCLMPTISSKLQAIFEASDGPACAAALTQVIPLALKHPAHVISCLGDVSRSLRQLCEALPDAGKDARRSVVARINALISVLLTLWPSLAPHIEARTSPSEFF